MSDLLFAPFAWMLLVLAGIAEISISAWTIAQYDYDFNNRTLKLRLSLFVVPIPHVTVSQLKPSRWCGIWMALIPGSYSFLSLNPKFSETPLEWGFYRFLWACAMVPPWIVVLVLLGILLPCDTVSLAYCRQLKALFGISLAQCVLSVLAVFVVPKIRYE
ncbi:hypothetical protein BDM02DRAFT_3194229 [Thelephora ganbajun]|uniref:Uncharacterized protein n=1 Tax=Thelephora ganbajun TaxID=370292 RepID=A0ACB6YWV6_THEGA|nr:hypothetical protein BDM02DRAFT_3194229 [Thelephora ganbajun]